jgi:hypothetical protein
MTKPPIEMSSVLLTLDRRFLSIRQVKIKSIGILF